MTDPDRRALERTTFDAWPPAVVALFDGERLMQKAGFTASLLVVDTAGDRPDDPVATPEIRTALLSAGELYAPDSRTLYFSLWPGSRGARALPARRAATLGFVAEAAFYQVQLHVEPAGTTAAGLACFRATIVRGEVQRVGYARLTAGITFELGKDAAAVIDRWARQVEALKAAAAAR
ncbi:hypothetical protein [Burkholderia alba]|uniref:hypothetical protein n=1 Tax=Burkholderia alba TaxID=2683677 RepID=UPI002B059742|nr:hypothetical protein [Burkholderia alba]